MISEPALIFMCGISGVGKSHLLAELAARRGDVTVASAGSIIGRARATGDRDFLRRLPANELEQNQALLVQGVRDLIPSVRTDFLVLDGHTLIDRDFADYYVIPTEVFEHLGLAGIIHLEGPPSDIAERRRSDSRRARPFRSIEELSRQQRISAERALELANLLRVFHASCNAGDCGTLEALILKCAAAAP